MQYPVLSGHESLRKQIFDGGILESIAPPKINRMLSKIVHISKFEITFLEFVGAKYSNYEQINHSSQIFSIISISAVSTQV